VFVSLDTESISAGEEWLRGVEEALHECAIFIVPGSPESAGGPQLPDFGNCGADANGRMAWASTEEAQKTA